MADEKPVALPVVAWQERQQKSHGEWTAWYDAGAPTSMGKGPGMSEVFGGIEYQWRPLTPLAEAQSAIAALQEQVRALEADAQRSLEERIAMAIDQSKLEEQLEAARVDAERWRFARDNYVQYFEPTHHWILSDKTGRMIREGTAYSYQEAIDASRGTT